MDDTWFDKAIRFFFAGVFASLVIIFGLILRSAVLAYQSGEIVEQASYQGRQVVALERIANALDRISPPLVEKAP